MSLLLIPIFVLPILLLSPLKLYLSCDNGAVECFLRFLLWKLPMRKRKSSSATLRSQRKGLADAVRTALGVLDKLKRKINIEKLKICFTEADPDPYSAVMKYNAMNAAVGSALFFVENTVVIKKKEIMIDIDRSLNASRIDFELGISVRVIWLIVPFIRLAAVKRKLMKGKDDTNG